MDLLCATMATQLLLQLKPPQSHSCCLHQHWGQP